MNPNIIFGNNDDLTNGDILTFLPEGARYDFSESQIVYTFTDMPGRNSASDFTHHGCSRHLALAIITRNLQALQDAQVAGTTEELCISAYLRFLALKYNLMSRSFSDSTINGCYNQVKYAKGVVNNVNTDLQGGDYTADDAVGCQQARKVQLANDVAQHLTVAKIAALNSSFYNIVCTIAFMFRTRGHHYLPDYDKKYISLWSKTTTARVFPNPNWNLIASSALHAIPPNVLENFWLSCVQNDTIDGMLKVRYHCAAAGTAAFTVLDSGVNDVTAVFPGLSKVLDHEINYLDKCVASINADRWAHSINAKFYNSDSSRLTETERGALGALVKACNDSLVDNSTLSQSKALERVARIAPIAGAAYNLAIKKYLNSDNYSNSLNLTG